MKIIVFLALVTIAQSLSAASEGYRLNAFAALQEITSLDYSSSGVDLRSFEARFFLEFSAV